MRIKQILDHIKEKTNSLEGIFTFSPPLIAENIEDNIITSKIPKEILSVLKIHNGIRLNDFKFWSLDEILANNKELQTDFQNLFDEINFKEIVFFGEYFSGRFGIKTEDKTNFIYEIDINFPNSEKILQVNLDAFLFHLNQTGFLIQGDERPPFANRSALD